MSGIAAGRLREERKAWRKGKNISKKQINITRQSKKYTLRLGSNSYVLLDSFFYF